MSGVIGSDGVQWEHCNCCGGWVKLQLLHYEKPSERYKYGRDLCTGCLRHLVDCYERVLPPKVTS